MNIEWTTSSHYSRLQSSEEKPISPDKWELLVLQFHINSALKIKPFPRPCAQLWTILSRLHRLLVEVLGLNPLSLPVLGNISPPHWALVSPSSLWKWCKTSKLLSPMRQVSTEQKCCVRNGMDMISFCKNCSSWITVVCLVTCELLCVKLQVYWVN